MQKGGTVFKRYLMVTAAAVVCSGFAGIAQSQAPSPAEQPRPSQQPPSPQTEPRATSESAASTTLTGCVYKEKDVPGRSPNVAERAGVMEDYILAEVRPASPSGEPAAVGTSGTTAPMYKLEQISDDKLQAVVGKRVEVTGRIDAEAGDAKTTPATPPTTSPTDKAIGRDKIDLPEFEVTNLKEVAGTCPATPGK